MTDETIGRKTSPGFGDPNAAVRGAPVRPTSTDASARLGGMAPQPDAHAEQPSQVAAAAPNHAARAVRGKPLVEVEVLRERARTPRPQPHEGCYEIWTQNHVYALDARMRCVEVKTPQTNQVRSDHPFLGGRLVGGQLEGDAMEMSHPLPRPGSFAVFELRKKTRRQFVRTSAVERVVLRLRIVTIADDGDVPSWEDVVDSDD